MFELVNGEKKQQLAFGHDDSINIDNITFEERVYFVRGVYRVFDRPKYIEFTSVFSETQPNQAFVDFLKGKKIIYGYTCYDTSMAMQTYRPYEHSLTFVQNKEIYG